MYWAAKWDRRCTKNYTPHSARTQQSSTSYPSYWSYFPCHNPRGFSLQERRANN